ncbi:hypothetical protein CRUP_009358 [Coryphaenoides rupestris]|nr:hypothetical protein CRUP_009358 [Coryphaenoides rupestris]
MLEATTRLSSCSTTTPSSSTSPSTTSSSSSSSAHHLLLCRALQGGGGAVALTHGLQLGAVHLRLLLLAEELSPVLLRFPRGFLQLPLEHLLLGGERGLEEEVAVLIGYDGDDPLTSLVDHGMLDRLHHPLVGVLGGPVQGCHLQHVPRIDVCPTLQHNMDTLLGH